MTENHRCPQGVENSERIKSLEARTKMLEQAIEDIRDRLLGRPTWIITVLFTLLTSTVVGLISAIIRLIT